MRTTPLLTTFSLSILLSLPLNAGIVERDFLTPSDGLLTYDNVNQREWLDLTYTSGMELAAIQSKMEPGRILEGFEFATLKDVEPFALSSEVQWQDTERVLDPLAIPSTLLPPPIAGPTYSTYEARELFDLLGNVITVEITNAFIGRPFFNLGTNSRFSFPDDYLPISSLTDFFRYSFGKIADDIIDEEPRFNGASVTVFSYGSISPARGILELQGTNGGRGGITMGLPEWIDGVPQATDDTGPFWLFRPAAVPEPSSIALMLIGATFACSRNRNR